MLSDDEGVQIALRIQKWLWKDIAESAKRSGWTFSAQVRHELAAIRGKAHTPYMPSPMEEQLNFSEPTQGSPGRKSRRRKKAA